jgi:hypothetical protein
MERGVIGPLDNLSKRALHDLLRGSGRTDLWTEMQGEAYGPRMPQAEAFPGAIDFFRRCRREGIAVRIISHRTRHPYRGPRHDLHAAARQWLEANGFHDASGVGLSPSHVFFEESRQDKLARIASEECTHFVEDLVEVIAEPEFPASVQAILFDPDAVAAKKGIRTFISRAESWAQIARLLGVSESREGEDR